MQYWLTCDPEEVLDEVIYARQLAGENLDASDAQDRQMAAQDFKKFQRDFSRVVQVYPTDGIAVYRAIVVSEDDLQCFEERGIGESWAFCRQGAHPYDRRSDGCEIIIQGEVSVSDVNWPMTVGMWSSGEGEIRLKNDAEVKIAFIQTKDGSIVRPDLHGERLSVRAPTRMPSI